jgi:hypothetical protein
LFADPARTIPWGDGGNAKAVSGLVGPTTPLRAHFTIYGRILSRQRQARSGTTPTRLSQCSIIEQRRQERNGASCVIDASVVARLMWARTFS